MASTTTVAIPPTIDSLIKSMAAEFSVPIVRDDHTHKSAPLSILEIENYFKHFSVYVKKLKNQIQAENAEREEENLLAVRAKQLEGDLRYALMAAEDVKALRAKASHLVECIRLEKDKVAAEKEKVEKYTAHVAILEDHIEKMVKLMKVEAGSKLKVIEQQRIERKELFQLREKNEKQAHMISLQKKLIAELRESTKVLVDQLKLMDDKYYELREKLELNRRRSNTEIDRMKKQCAELRTKFALATGKANLDSIKLPNSQGFDGDEDGWRPMSSTGSKSPGHTSRPNTAPGPRAQGHMQRSHSPSILAMRMKQLRSQNAEAPSDLPKEERLNIVLEKISMKDEKLNGKKWTREGLHDLLNCK